MSGILPDIRIGILAFLFLTAWTSPRGTARRLVSYGALAGWLFSDSLYGLVQDYYGKERWLTYLQTHWYAIPWGWWVGGLSLALIILLHARGRAFQKDRRDRFIPHS